MTGLRAVQPGPSPRSAEWRLAAQGPTIRAPDPSPVRPRESTHLLVLTDSTATTRRALAAGHRDPTATRGGFARQCSASR